ncbi:MAG: hypothetical protein EXX96DRAFT_569008 [Benjaminiella poitrasii]|nr:MAG: hypothetical protein EXX96DRAFT_569008 [Benjaminiella poitrasii]
MVKGECILLALVLYALNINLSIVILKRYTCQLPPFLHFLALASFPWMKCIYLPETLASWYTH